MAAEEFAGPALVLGSVRGLRSFGVRADGQLTGLFYTQPWQPGENRAACFHEGGVVVRLPNGRITVQGSTAREIGPAHGLQGCTCGFYAYYRSDPYGSSGRISGVVEGYGRIVLGTKGFRAEKARIAALLLPPGAPGPGDLPARPGGRQGEPLGEELIDGVRAVPADEDTRVDYARIRERYPDVAVFTDEDAMLAEFPPTENGPTL